MRGEVGEVRGRKGGGEEEGYKGNMTTGRGGEGRDGESQ